MSYNFSMAFYLDKDYIQLGNYEMLCEENVDSVNPVG